MLSGPVMFLVCLLLFVFVLFCFCVFVFVGVLGVFCLFFLLLILFFVSFVVGFWGLFDYYFNCLS